jgi:hypothetical protein
MRCDGPVDERPPVDAVQSSPTPVLPAVFCPFPPRVSPHLAAVHRYAVRWATRHGLLPTARERATFARARFAALMARAYPDASYPDVCLTVSWLTVTFILDDHLESTLGRSPDVQRELAGEVLDHFAGGQPPARLGRPLAGALEEVWTRTVARTTPAWRERFVGHVGCYLAANAWEADNRSRNRTPPIGEYVRMRRHSAATAMFFDLVEALAEVPADPDPFAEAGLALLRTHADNVVAWFNDLVSWPKEAAGGDPHNLVLVVGRELRVPTAAAIRHVVERHDHEVREFIAARDRYGSRLATHTPVRRAVDGLQCWIRANVDWSRESGRYV